MLRRTKIIATLGPATDKPEMMDKIISAGVDLVRTNFSHGNREDHIERIEQFRNRAHALGRPVGVIADLQGPKIRIDRFKQTKVILEEGALFILDTRLDGSGGTTKSVGISYKQLPDDVNRDDILLLDDGRITLSVEEVKPTQVICRVLQGGELSDHKGINRQGGGLTAQALTDKDREDIVTAAQMKADYLGVSFARSAADVNKARELLRSAGGSGDIVAKIERAEALDDIESIIEASDSIMIARGDLGVEIGDAALPPVQKRLITLARSMKRSVITATQMMESMIHTQVPTRAEVFDVANAVLDGTDAVMLSAETATGNYPDKAIAAMDRICSETEKQHVFGMTDQRMNMRFERIDEAVALATMYTANHLGVKAIVCLTESGSTPLWMSRINSQIPVYAMTRHVETRRRVTLYRGVYPISFDVANKNYREVHNTAVNELVRRDVVSDGDLIILTEGELMGVHGGTNTMKIFRVGEV